MDFQRSIDSSDIELFADMVAEASQFVITCHMTPDGDALGSSLGLCHVLGRLGKKAVVITPDTPASTLDFLPGFSDIVIASRFPDRVNRALSAADVVICLDFNSLKRIDRLAPAVEACDAKKILIDHHLNPERFADLTISRPDQSSTCALLFHILWQAGMYDQIDIDAATCIYTGMLTDTGNFSYNSNDPDLYLIISLLLAKGLDKDEVYSMAWNTHRAESLRINGYALYRKMQILPEHQLAVIILERDELNEFSYVKGDTEGLVNKPLAVPGVTWSVYLRQDEPDFVKVSMRSKGCFPVNVVCERLFGGGGHLNAAGGEFTGTVSEALDVLLAAIDEFDQYLELTEIPQKNYR